MPNSASGFNFLGAVFSLLGVGGSTGGESQGIVYQDRRLFPTKEEALEAAKAKGVQLAAGVVTIDLTCAGRPDIFAERPITLTGFREPLNSTWMIQSVTHEFSGKGYSTKITCGTSGKEGEQSSSS